ncbi:MAG: class II glutamine amidotransferase [Anaerostipes sp.]|jgi:predicted glutamine amidotransferase|nr:class II glutamine amidotransferase [Anaerostipes sp.]MDD3746958.1 class II glutamine amidotransferase [Anaerostipes sp.]
MCELFGFSSRKRCDIGNYLKEFYSHSKEHPNGWGLACIRDGNVNIEKEPKEAQKSCYLKERLSVPVKESVVLAHIRYATIGNVEYKNCHPYVRQDDSKRTWTLIHNGTIFDFPLLTPYIEFQEGNTDSERILMFLVDQINYHTKVKNRDLTERERFDIIDLVFRRMAKGNKLNLIIYDGDVMYVHTNYKNSLYYLDMKDGVLFSTRPLDENEWKPVLFTRLLAYRRGRQIMEGTSHNQEYIEREEDVKHLYQIYSAL